MSCNESFVSLIYMNKKAKPLLTEEQMQNIEELGKVLRGIAYRLVSEGKAKIKDGKVIFLKK